MTEVVACPACQAPGIHPDAPACPTCGKPSPGGKPKTPKDRWSKRLAIIIAAVAIVSFVYKDDTDKNLTRKITTFASLRASQQALQRHEELLESHRETLQLLDLQAWPTPSSAGSAALFYELRQIHATQAERDKFRILEGKVHRIHEGVYRIDELRILARQALQIKLQIDSATHAIHNVMEQYHGLVGIGIAPARLSQAETDSLTVLLKDLREAYSRPSVAALERRVHELDSAMEAELTALINQLSRRADLAALVIYILGFIGVAGALLGKFLV